MCNDIIFFLFDIEWRRLVYWFNVKAISEAAKMTKSFFFLLESHLRRLGKNVGKNLNEIAAMKNSKHFE
jgi:hypothetical protein